LHSPASSSRLLLLLPLPRRRPQGLQKVVPLLLQLPEPRLQFPLALPLRGAQRAHRLGALGRRAQLALLQRAEAGELDVGVRQRLRELVQLAALLGVALLQALLVVGLGAGFVVVVVAVVVVG